MSDFNVESFNYDYAHKCYLVYASGDTSAADSMYEKGKEVAESKKWINYVTKWQTEDVTVYDMDDEERKELDENGPAEKTGALAGEITGGVLAAGGLAAGATAAAVAKKAAASGATGNPAAAIIFAVVGVLFLALTSTFYVLAKNGRKDQESYLKEADKAMEYDFQAKLEETQAMSEEIIAAGKQAAEITKAANIEISNANNVAATTATSAEEISVTAQAEADEGASAIIADLEDLDTGIIDNIPKLDEIFNEIQTKQDTFMKIESDIPKFEKNRKDQRTLMITLCAAGGIAAAAGAIGMALAWQSLAGAAATLACLVIGIAAFAVSAILAGIEISPQKQAMDKLKEETEKTQKTVKDADNVERSVISVRNDASANDAALTEMSSEAQEEDANVNSPNGEAA